MKLHDDLLKRLANSSDKSEFRKNYNDALTAYHLGHSQYMDGHVLKAKKTCEVGLTIAIKYGIVDVGVKLSRVIILIDSLHGFKQSRAESMYDILDKFLSDQKAELIAEKYYADIVSRFASNKKLFS